ncbi:MAG: tyrosine-type recombinase/integrase [Ruminococcus sp.]|nr:tyrosine-type recombinase/integrase [Ruminococcus sp.]
MKQEYYDDCPYYLEDFLTNMKIIRNRADLTEEAYYIDIRTFLRYLKLKHRDVPEGTEWGDISIKDVPLEYIENFSLNDAHVYLRFLKDKRGNATATRARKSSALKQFYIYLHQKAKLIESDPMQDLELPTVKNKLPKFLSLEDSNRLLDSIDSKNKARDYCIILLFLNCGMRLSELVALNFSDYSKENRTLRLFGKGSKERIIYLNDACIEALEDYIHNARPNETAVDKNAIFLSANKTRINKRRVQQIVEESLARAGLSNLGITTHKLRHTAATLMYQYGNVDTLVLKEQLGHKSVGTTEINTHQSNENLKAAAEANPLAGRKGDKKDT